MRLSGVPELRADDSAPEERFVESPAVIGIEEARRLTALARNPLPADSTATIGLAFEQVAHEVATLETLCASYTAQGGPHGRRMALVRSHLETARLHAQEGVREVQELPF